MIRERNEISKSVKAYYSALDRLISQNKRISYDAVALEAGRGRGAIKGNSLEIIELKKAISKAKDEQTIKTNLNSPQEKLANAKRIKDNYRLKYEELKKINEILLTQLVSTVFELEELKIEFERVLKSKKNILKF
ncbi:hypothetical protein [Acinetobacter soli]|uniref:hypothetical protein n=1 Tax=Acinetobacter soli TaxID=487316 RepID=UPI00148C21D8|nr:hypothetical protein [Acinetobacter soli]